MNNSIDQIREHLWQLVAQKSITDISHVDFPHPPFDPLLIQRLFPENHFYGCFILAEMEVLVGTLSTDPNLEASDRLFDILMQLFDALDDKQLPIRHMMASLQTAPSMWPKLLPYSHKISTQIMHSAHIDQIDIKPDFITAHFPKLSLPIFEAPGLIKNASFQIFLIWIFYKWSGDKSLDKEETMAALQKILEDLKTYIVFESVKKQVYVF